MCGRRICILEIKRMIGFIERSHGCVFFSSGAGGSVSEHMIFARSYEWCGVNARS